jgi:hypothetical protein
MISLKYDQCVTTNYPISYSLLLDQVLLRGIHAISFAVLSMFYFDEHENEE